MSPQFQQKDGDGVLFKNTEKEQPNHPDYRGSITINGHAYWLSAWLKEAKSGTKYMSLSARPKLAKDTPGAVTHKERDDDGPVPF